MTAIAELIERLEKATGPDREIDELLAPVAGCTPAGFTVAYGKAWVDRNGEYVRAAPKYTASIDAALTLVPSDHGAEFGFPIPGGNGHPWADVWWGDDDGAPRQVHVNAKTLAIALCIAALRARQAGGGDE